MVVVAVVAVLIVVNLTRSKTAASSTTGAQPNVVAATTGLTSSQLSSAGVGSGAVSPPVATKGATPLVSNGKPEVLYIGAEYCPYCAAERWPMVVALSRFGTFSHLGQTESSTTDKYPGTKTFSFYGSTYSSRYLTFTPVETQTNQPAKSGGGYVTLQTPTPAQQKLQLKYDAAPYTTSPGIPFIDFGNKYLVLGASYNPSVLQGLSMATIAGSLSDPSSPPAKAILGTSNLLTAAICKMTGEMPASVCATPSITKAEAALKPPPAGA
ncbi:MAG: DUF929 family protein [Acidimicrobiales bacterium]